MCTVEQIALFDAIALSYEIGTIKPDIRAYDTIARRLAVTPSNCLMVDDQKLYCEGAIKAGMQALHYTNFLDFKQALTGLL
jgi:HAD superfamily hydrolase (TIGR01509 family)